MKQRNPGPFYLSQEGFFELPDELAFGTANSGLSEHHSQMGGQAKTLRMGDSLPIEQDEVHIRRQAGQNLLQRRTFPKAEEPRDIGKPHLEAQILLLQEFQLRIAKEECPGPGPIFSFRIRHIRGSQKANPRVQIHKEDLTP
jgi:hypothetical protein